MERNVIMSVVVSLRTIGEAIAYHLVVRPIRGIGEVLAGLALAGPELVQAIVSATVEAVGKHLGEHGQAKVREGRERVLVGAKEMAAPLAVAAAIWICWNPCVLYWSSAAVLVLAMGLAVD